QSAIQVAMTRANNLATAIAGAPDPKAAEAQATELGAQAAAPEMRTLGVTIAPGASLKDTISQLIAKVQALGGELKARADELAAAGKQHTEDVGQLAKIQAETTAKIEEQGKQLADAMAQLN